MNTIAKSVVTLKLILMILSHLCTCDSNDHIISEVNLTEYQYKHVKYLKEFNEDMPKPCRTDICPAAYNNSERKGEFKWPEISVGQQVQLRCTYTLPEVVYTTRECEVNYRGIAEWGQSDFEEVCPDPPLAELIQQFQKEENDSSIIRNKEYYEKLLTRTRYVFMNYRDPPIEYQDVRDLLKFVTSAMDFLLVGPNSISIEVGANLLDIWDRLMEKDLEVLAYQALIELPYQLKLNAHLANLPFSMDTGNFIIKKLNIMVYITSVTMSDTAQTINITDVFEFYIENTTETVYSPNISLLVSSGEELTGQTIKVGLTIVKDVYFFDEKFSLKEPAEIEQPYCFVIKRTEPEEKTSTTTEPIIDVNALAYSKIVPYFEKLGSIIYLNSTMNTSVNGNNFIKIAYDMHTCEYDEESCLNQWNSFQPSCVKSSNSFVYDVDPKFSTAECTELTPGTVRYTSCQCSGHGVYAIFLEKIEGGSDVLNPPKTGIKDIDDVVVVEGDIATFLGFPYRRELEIVGNILGVISLACLIATVLSYAVFRNTRRGSPTTILLNLCVALIILSIMLFGINMSGTIMNMTGCTVSNALRYYLVFVTLMWNAVEAFNMYLMLIKVFDSNVSYFAVKAGIIAWGIPGVMVGVCLAVNKKAFNGQFVLVSEALGECVFKCQLRTGTLYYGYLIPMCVIILHNVIIFGFVLKAIIQHGNRIGKSTKKNRSVQLIGAVATLVLLGVPWIFSAFGAIDAATDEKLNNMEGVFQVVFVLSVNLQGLFIFIFHCARNAQMRESWSSVVKRSSFNTKSTHSSNSTSFSKTSSDKRKPPIPVDTVSRMPENQQFYNIVNTENYVN